MSRRRKSRRAALFCVAVAIAVQSAGAQSAPDRTVGRLRYSTDPTTIVLSYQEIVGEFAAHTNVPLLRIYGDGRLLVHRPAFMSNAGDYQTHLSPAELDSLLASIDDAGLPEFDGPGTRRALKAAARQPDLYYASDPSTFVFGLNLQEYRPIGTPAGVVAPPLKRSIEWRGLRADARRHPEIVALQKLAAVERQLHALARHPRLAAIQQATE